jgi:hypothetical protein
MVIQSNVIKIRDLRTFDWAKKPVEVDLSLEEETLQKLKKIRFYTYSTQKAHTGPYTSYCLSQNGGPRALMRSTWKSKERKSDRNEQRSSFLIMRRI